MHADHARTYYPDDVVSADDFMVKFRCLSCGALADLGDVPSKIITFLVSRQHPGPPCAACGGQNWVRCGTTTEFYRWTRGEDVCAVGGHVAPDATMYTLLPRAPVAPHPDSGTTLASLQVCACPLHVEQLRVDGINGFFLVD